MAIEFVDVYRIRKCQCKLQGGQFQLNTKEERYGSTIKCAAFQKRISQCWEYPNRNWMNPFHLYSCNNLPTGLQTSILLLKSPFSSQSSKQIFSNLITLFLKTFQGLSFSLRIKSKFETLAFKALNNLAMLSPAVHLKLIFSSPSRGLCTSWYLC